MPTRTVEALPFTEFIQRYDRPTTLFYLDPPYFDCESDYGPGLFTREDFSRLALQLGQIRGRFLLSLNDTPEVREIFNGFAFEAVKTTYSVGRANGATAREIIISTEPKQYRTED